VTEVVGLPLDILRWLGYIETPLETRVRGCGTTWCGRPTVTREIQRGPYAPLNMQLGGIV
jgi:hypothetical protein